MNKIYKFTIAGIALLLFNSGISLAQENQVFNFGIKGGYNYSWLNLDDTKDETGKSGFHAGVVGRVNFLDHVAVQAEALYSTMGSKVVYDNAFFNGDATLRLNYIEVPLLLVLKLNQNINFQIGPYASFIVDASAKNNSSVNLFDFEDEVDTDNFKNTDFGGVVGVGVEGMHIMGGVRYSQGFTEIAKDKEYNGSIYKFPDAKNSIVQVYAGFIF